jgi:hypothetical protein
MLALGGCGYSSAPDGYAPAADFDCGPLIGDWVLSGPGDLQWLAPERPLPDGVRFTFLSIEEDHNGQVRMVLRRRLGDVLAEATTMRLTHPDDYRRWRARTLHEPEPDGPLYATVQDAGPVVDIEMGQAFNACENGWRHSPSLRDGGRSGGDEPANQTYTLAFALDERRNLVVQQRVSREHGTDWSFFGQPAGTQRVAAPGDRPGPAQDDQRFPAVAARPRAGRQRDHAAARSPVRSGGAGAARRRGALRGGRPLPPRDRGTVHRRAAHASAGARHPHPPGERGAAQSPLRAGGIHREGGRRRLARLTHAASALSRRGLRTR